MPIKARNRNKEKSVIDKLEEANEKSGKKMPGKKAGAKIGAKKREKAKYTLS